MKRNEKKKDWMKKKIAKRERGEKSMSPKCPVIRIGGGVGGVTKGCKHGSVRC